MSTTFCGWTTEQWAAAKSRHLDYTGEDAKPDAVGMVGLQRWWHQRQWADPLSVRFEGVAIQRDDVWAMRAMRAAMEALAR